MLLSVRILQLFRQGTICSDERETISGTSCHIKEAVARACKGFPQRAPVGIFGLTCCVVLEKKHRER
jgi:hypothetical protein